MKAPTYQEQFNKLTVAYIQNKVNPDKDCACFIGNLLNNNGDWARARSCNFYRDPTKKKITNLNPRLLRPEWLANVIEIEACGFYSPNDIILMEELFLNTYMFFGGDMEADINEEALFISFEKTLDLLKAIHESKGEVIDSKPIFVKRKLTFNAI